MREAVAEFERTLFYDSEDVMAHYNLALLYESLGDASKAAEHRALHARYKPDDNAQELAVNSARLKYEAANHAAERLVIYPLNRKGAPQLPDEFAVEPAPFRRAQAPPARNLPRGQLADLPRGGS
jgi:hypothetical protein